MPFSILDNLIQMNMNTISNFHSSLFILFESYQNLERLYFQFKEFPQSGIESYTNPFVESYRNYIILEAASFLDEYEINFLEINNRSALNTKKKSKKPVKPIEQQYWNRIENLHKIITPLLRTMNRWTEIRKYRNNFVAHTNRSDWKDGYNLIIAGQEPYDAPRTFFEFQILHDIIHIMFGLISQEFRMELIDAWFIARSLKCFMNPRKDNSNIQQELLDMINEFNKECEQQGKDYTLNVPPIEYVPLKQMVENMNEYNHPLTHMSNYIRNHYSEILSKIKNELNPLILKKKSSPDNVI